MPIPSTPQELNRRIATLDQELMTLIREIEQRRARGEETGELQDVLARVRSERVHLQFFVVSDLSSGGPPPREPPARASAVAEPSLRIGGGPSSAKRWVVLGVVVGVASIGWLLVRGSAPTPVATRVEEAPLLPPPAVEVTRVPTPLTPSRPGPDAGPLGDAGASETVRWKATVASAAPGSVAVGAACTLTASLRPVLLSDLEKELVVARVAGGANLVVAPTVECGGARLFAAGVATAAAADDPRRRAYLWERPGADVGQYELWLQYEELATQPAPRGIRIDTPGRRITLWDEGQNPVRIELTVETWATRVGAALNVGASPSSIGFLDIERAGRVTAASGLIAATAGDRCSFRLVPNDGPRLTCRANLKCGETVVYGSGTTGYLECSYVDGLPTAALDAEADDGDPSFDMNLPGNKLTARSDQPGEAFTVAVALDPAAPLK